MATTADTFAVPGIIHQLVQFTPKIILKIGCYQ